MRIAGPVGRRLSLAALVAMVAACSPGPEPGVSTSARSLSAPAIPAPRRELSRETMDPMRLSPEDLAWVTRTAEELTLRQKAAQVVMPWISGASPSRDRTEFARMLRWVEEEQVGGLIVSTGTPSALADKLQAAQARARVPLLIASDLETGPAMRLRPGGTDIPPAMALGAAGSEALARAAGEVTGIEARAVGIHVTLGPVLDVNSNPENPIINIRSFGEDPERVARLASAWIEGARGAGLQTVGKHFPGHGDTEVDSHLGLATIAGDPARLAAVELVPFRRAIRAGVDGVLVGHIAVPELDGADAGPASLSPGITRGLLRERLGFEGLVVTDALNMGAVTGSYPVAEASIRALLAGADLLLQPPGAPAVIDAIVGAVESGRLPRERLDEAVERVLRAKARAGLHRGTRGAAADPSPPVGAPEHRAVAERIARASVTLVRDRADLVPLPAEPRRVLHVGYADGGSGSSGGRLVAELRAAGHTVDHVRIGGAPGRGELDALRTRAQSADLVLASVRVAPHQYRALGLRGGLPALLEELAAAGRPVVVVSLGSPYLLDSFPSVPTYLLAWSASEDSQRAAADAILGRAPVTGRLPVSLPPHHRAGDGLERSPAAR